MDLFQGLLSSGTKTYNKNNKGNHKYEQMDVHQDIEFFTL